MDYTESKKNSATLRESKLRSYSSDGTMPFLSLESWGEGEGSSFTNYYVYSDGKYVKEDSITNRKVLQSEDTKLLHERVEIDRYTTTLSSEKISEIMMYVDENVKESTTLMMEDARYVVIYLKEGQEIRIENDMELYNKIKEMLPTTI